MSRARTSLSSERFTRTVSKYFEVRQGDITTIRFTEPELFDTTLVAELKEQLIDFTERETPKN